MSIFRDIIFGECESIFLNDNEFARDILIDGMPVRAVIDDSTRPFATTARDDFQDTAGLGLLEGIRTVFLREGALPRVPQPEQEVSMAESDGAGQEIWRIEDVRHEDGMAVVQLTRVYA